METDTLIVCGNKTAPNNGIGQTRNVDRKCISNSVAAWIFVA